MPTELELLAERVDRLEHQLEYLISVVQKTIKQTVDTEIKAAMERHTKHNKRQQLEAETAMRMLVENKLIDASEFGRRLRK